MSSTPYKKLRMAKSKKNKTKAKLNLTVREEQRNKLEQMASIEKRSVLEDPFSAILSKNPRLEELG
jgi:uncharacterized protein (DUF1778 family)